MFKAHHSWPQRCADFLPSFPSALQHLYYISEFSIGNICLNSLCFCCCPMSSSKQVFKMFFEILFFPLNLYNSPVTCIEPCASYLLYRKLQHTNGLIFTLVLPTVVSEDNCIYVLLSIGGRVPR